MKIINLFILGLLLLTLACKKEDKLQPSGLDENPLVIKDNPNDPVDHAIFGFYQSSGIPVFYNDTIYKKQIADSAGIPKYFYQTLGLTYSPEGSVKENLRFTRLTDKNKVLPMISYLNQELLPAVPKSIFIPSVFMLNTLDYRYYKNVYFVFPINAYHGFNTLGLKIVNPDTMDVVAKRRYNASVWGILAQRHLIKNSPEILSTKFYSVSNALGTSVYEANFTTLTANSKLKKLEEFGFLSFQPGVRETNPTIKTNLTPSQSEDLKMYFRAVFIYTRAEFTQLYGIYNPVMAKYEVARKFLTDIGFTINN